MSRSTHRVPTSAGRETVRVASRVAAGRDIVQRRLTSGGVQEGVEETERRLAGSSELIVEQSDDARKDGRRAAGSVDQAELVAEDDLDVLSLGRDIGERTTGARELP